MRIYRLEFLQPDGRWTGPYTAEYMTAAAFRLREMMLEDHRIARPYPAGQIFADNPGRERYVCGSPSEESLCGWFGEYLQPLLREGGHIGVYDVPDEAIAENDGRQIVYQQRRAACIRRAGKPVPAHMLICKIHPGKQ